MIVFTFKFNESFYKIRLLVFKSKSYYCQNKNLQTS